MDKLLRRSLGVSEADKPTFEVKPAPPKAAEAAKEVKPDMNYVHNRLESLEKEHEEDETEQDDSEPPKQAEEKLVDRDGKPQVILPDHLKGKVSIKMDEVDEDGKVVHDEL